MPLENNKPRMLKTTKPYQWQVFIFALVPTCAITTLAGFMIDQVLLEFGVGIQSKIEAITVALFAFVLSAFAVPLLWRLGLASLPQYLLGGLALIVPSTLLSLLFIALYTPVLLNLSSIETKASASEMWAFTIYLRFVRSAVLLPIHICSFWLIYHKLLNRAGKQF